MHMRGWGLVASVVLFGTVGSFAIARITEFAVINLSQTAAIPVVAGRALAAGTSRSCSSDQKSAGDKANSMCPEPDGISTYYDKSRSCGEVYDQAKCSGLRSASVEDKVSQVAASVVAGAVLSGCAKNKANCSCGESQANAVVIGTCVAPHTCRANRTIARDGSACIYGEDCSAQCVAASTEGKQVYDKLDKEYGGTSQVTPVSVSDKSTRLAESANETITSAPPVTQPNSRSSIQPSLNDSSQTERSQLEQTSTRASESSIEKITSAATNPTSQGSGTTNPSNRIAPAATQPTTAISEEKFWSNIASQKPQSLGSSAPIVSSGAPATSPVSVSKTSPTSISTTQTTSRGTSFTSQFSRASFTTGNNAIKSSVSGSGNTGFGSGTSALFSFVSSFVSGFVSSLAQNTTSQTQTTVSSNRKQVVTLQPQRATSTYTIVSPAPSVLNIVTGEVGEGSGRAADQRNDLALLDRTAGIGGLGESAGLLPLSLYDQAPALTDAAAAHAERSVGVIPTPAARNIFTDATLVSSSTLADAIAMHAAQLNASLVIRDAPPDTESIGTTLAAGESGHAVSVVDLISAIMTGSIAKVRAVLGFGRAATSVALEGPATDRVALPIDAGEGRDSFGRAAQWSDAQAANDTAARAARQNSSESLVLSLPTPAWNPVQALTAIAPALQPYVPAPSFVPVFTSVSSSVAPSESSSDIVSGSSYPADSLSVETAAEVTSDPVGAFFGQIGTMFRQLLGWFFGGVVEENATSAAREGDVSVRFIADPPRAVRGAQTTLYWTSSGADDCAVFTQDGNVFAHGSEGFALTPPLADGTQFFITCSSGEAVVRTAVFVGVQ